MTPPKVKTGLSRNCPYEILTIIICVCFRIFCIVNDKEKLEALCDLLSNANSLVPYIITAIFSSGPEGLSSETNLPLEIIPH